MMSFGTDKHCERRWLVVFGAFLLHSKFGYRSFKISKFFSKNLEALFIGNTISHVDNLLRSHLVVLSPFADHFLEHGLKRNGLNHLVSKTVGFHACHIPSEGEILAHS